MSGAYVPQAGSHAERAIALLRERHQLPAEVLAEALGIAKGNLRSNLAVAIKHWVIGRELDGDRFVYRFIPEDQRPQGLPRARRAYKRREKAVEEAPPQFNLGMYLDGELVILGAQQVNKDGTVVIGKEQVTVLRDFLLRTVPPAPFVLGQPMELGNG